MQNDNEIKEELKDCSTCKYGWCDDHWNILMCHNEDCKNWELWEAKNAE